MNEDPTKDLPSRSFEERVLSELAAIRGDIAEIRGDIAEIRGDIAEIRVQQTAMAKNVAALDHRLTALEERVDTRLKETRPIWEAVQEQLQRLDQKFELVIKDLYDVRNDVAIYGRRLTEVERRVQS